MDAIVIGAGPAGLATSLGLSKCCRRVYLVEKQARFEARGATFGIAPNGKKALNEICAELWARLEQVGVNLPDGAGGGLLMVWWQMRDVLLQRVQETNSIELLTGEIMTNIVEQHTTTTAKDTTMPVQVEFQSGLVLQGDLVVGADGVHSSVRAWLGRPPALPTKSSVFRGSLQVTETCSPRLQQLLDKGLVPLGSKNQNGIYFIVFNFHSKQPGRLAWVVSTTQEVPSDGTRVTAVTLLREIVTDPDEWELISEIFQLSGEEQLKPFPPTSVMDFSDDTLASMNGGWGGKGHVTLVGDAAHAMRPTDGQGGNQAFEDAVILCRFLDTAKHDNVASALAAFEALRLPRVKRIHDQQRMRYEARMRGETVGPPSKEFAEWLNAGV